jgi:hypothetical protein
MTYNDKNNNPVGKIALRSPEDWLLWSDQFKSKAKSAQLWQYIEAAIAIPSETDRETLAEAIKMPQKPKISQFRKRSPNGARSAGAATNLTELVPEDIAIWTALTANYTSERKDQELLIKRLDTLQEWVRNTVAQEYLRLCCTSDKEVDAWYVSLKARLGTDLLDRKTRARQQYDNVLAMPRRKRLANKKEVEEWLSKWDNAYSELIEAGFKDPKEASLWFADYTQALSSSCYENWIYSYHSSNLTNMRKNTLTTTDVLLDTRFFLNSVANDHLPLRGKAKGGAFGPTDADGSASPSQGSEDANRGQGQRGRGRGRGPRGARGRGYPRGERGGGRPMKIEHPEGEEKSGRCDACYGWHPLATCFYLFEKMRPDWWLEDQDIAQIIRKRLLADEELAERVRKVKTLTENN